MFFCYIFLILEIRKMSLLLIISSSLFRDLPCCLTMLKKVQKIVILEYQNTVVSMESHLKVQYNVNLILV